MKKFILSLLLLAFSVNVMALNSSKSNKEINRSYSKLSINEKIKLHKWAKETDYRIARNIKPVHYPWHKPVPAKRPVLISSK
jgi:hypothetical protein